jgi:hypothetical protein
MNPRCPPDDAPFRFYNKTDEDVYNEGYKSAITWPAYWNHLPGGPYVSRYGEHDHPDWVAYCKTRQRHHGEWMRGWYEGFAQAAKLRPEIRRLRTKLLMDKLTGKTG